MDSDYQQAQVTRQKVKALMIVGLGFIVFMILAMLLNLWL